MPAERPDVKRILDMADLITPMAIRVAVTLRLVDHMSNGVRTVQDLAMCSGAHSRPLTKLLDHLVSLDLLRKDDTGRYCPTATGEMLHTGNDSLGITTAWDLDHVAGQLDMGMTSLLHTVRTGDAVYDAALGRDLWEHLNSGQYTDDALKIFTRTTPVLDAELIIDRYDWSGVDHVMDVGGNTGALLEALLTTHEHLSGTLLELPVFARLAELRLRDHRNAGRCDVVAQSFFEPLPRGSDVYLLSAILADWGDDQAVEILQNCSAAASPNGRVLLSEVHLAGANLDRESQTAIDLWLEASMKNPDRSAREVKDLAARAGLTSNREASSRFRSLIEFRPA